MEVAGLIDGSSTISSTAAEKEAAAKVRRDGLRAEGEGASRLAEIEGREVAADRESFPFLPLPLLLINNNSNNK